MLSRVLLGSAIAPAIVFCGFWQAEAAAQSSRTGAEGVELVGRTVKAINYQHRSGATKIDFRGTSLLAGAGGEAKVESKRGYLEIDAKFRGLTQARGFGSEYFTYVLWAVTPEGRPENLGEVLLRGDQGNLKVTTQLQAFGLVVTAEPYFSVTYPSDIVVLENAVRGDTRGRVDEIEARYDLLKRGQYVSNEKPDELTARLMVVDPKVPLQLYEARNAIRIARWTGAEKHAAGPFQKAVDQLLEAERYQARKRPETKAAAMMARQAVQTAEDARLIAVRSLERERLALERKAANEREATAQANADAESRLRAKAEVDLQQAERLRAEAEAARQMAQEERLKAEQAAAEAIRNRQQAEQMAQQAETKRAEALSELTRLQLETQQELTKLQAARTEALAQKATAEAAAEKSSGREAAAAARADAESLLRSKAEVETKEAERLRLGAEAARQASEQERLNAELAVAEANRNRQQAEQMAQQAETKRAEALAALTSLQRETEQELAKLQAARAEALAQKAAAEAATERSDRARADLRQRLQTQLNKVLETNNTARGLIVNMSDVVFDTAKYTLRPSARENSARISGILAMQPDLKVEVEGHTDNIGGDNYNQMLSEQRAASVRSFLIEHGIEADAITSRGYGETRPKAGNETAAGRQQNRRVELVVTGASIDATANGRQ